MSDPRLKSAHLEFPRRQECRRRREALLGDRGLLTLAAGRVFGLVDNSDEWPIRPDHVLPGTRYLLVDHPAGCVYELKTGLNTLGRHPNNDVRFEELHVSRRHCVLLVHAWGGCDLHDTASRNGTFVNGVRVDRPVRLTSGDCVQVCRRRLLFASEKDYRDGEWEDEHPATIVE
jgi:hypothetical protein